MLTDIFADRYENTPITYASLQRVKRFMMQASLMITNQILPLYETESENSGNSAILRAVHSDLCMELGFEKLTPISDQNGLLSIRQQTANFFDTVIDVEEEDLDMSIKERLSFIELAFRQYESLIKSQNKDLISKRIEPPEGENFSGYDFIDDLMAMSDELLEGNIHELRERFKKAGLPLTYSGGYIQFSDDEFVENSIKRPFWIAINDPKWASVEHDMHVAIDLRDTGRTGAAASAAKALESTIKIISKEKGWDRGNEKGAAQYIDNLVTEKNGRFIEVWEANVLKSFFAEVRNRLQHGAGSEPVTILSKQQDDWAIETCMSWIKSLVNRV